MVLLLSLCLGEPLNPLFLCESGFFILVTSQVLLKLLLHLLLQLLVFLLHEVLLALQELVLGAGLVLGSLGSWLEGALLHFLVFLVHEFGGKLLWVRREFYIFFALL